jgi:hypothetical protein
VADRADRAEHGVDVGEVDGKDGVGLGRQELSPCGGRTSHLRPAEGAGSAQQFLRGERQPSELVDAVRAVTGLRRLRKKSEPAWADTLFPSSSFSGSPR